MAYNNLLTCHSVSKANDCHSMPFSEWNERLPFAISYCKFSKNSPTIMQLSKIISKFALQSSDCRHNYAESVSLFSQTKCRKFQKRENRQTSCSVIPSGVAWSCCLFCSFGFPTTSFAKISFQHHAFFFMFLHWCWGR